MLFFCLALLAAFGLRLHGVPAGFVDGTSVSGIDLSGQNLSQARQRISRIKPEPVVVYLDEEKILIPSRYLDIRPRAARAVSRAAEAQPSRLERAFGMGDAPETELEWSYQPDGVRKALLLLEREGFRAARPARYQFSGEKLGISSEQSGRELVTYGLAEKLHQAASRGGGVVLARTRPKRSPLTRKSLLRRDPVVLVVDKSDFKLTVYRRLEAERSFPVAIGMPGFETPEGRFQVESKAVDPAWLAPEWSDQAGQLIAGGTPANPLVSRWIGIVDGVGFHGTRDTWSLGSAASHGCLRMDPGQVEELYDMVEVGTPVFIQA